MPDVPAVFEWAKQVVAVHSDWTWLQRSAFVIGAFIAATGDGPRETLIDEFYDRGLLVRGGWVLSCIRSALGETRLDLQRVC